MEIHRRWFKYHWADVTRLLDSHAREVKRIAKFCDPKLLGNDARVCDINDFASEYVLEVENRASGMESYYDHFDMVVKTRGKIDRLKRVRSLDDLTELRGIGPATQSKIKASFNGSAK